MEEATATPTTAPTPDEQKIHSLTLRNGIELQLGIQDQLIVTQKKISQQYPHHLIFIQSGDFLQAYGKSAYFMHKLRNYQLKIVGTETAPEIRCGLPTTRHKKRLWDIFYEFKVPYIIALGRKGNYILHISHENIEHSLIDEIPQNIITEIIASLSQTNNLRTANMVQLLLKPEQITFRLKQVANNLYFQTNKDVECLPTNKRYFIGKDVSTCMFAILNLVYEYSLSQAKKQILISLSAQIDLLKTLIQFLYKSKVLIENKYNERMSHAIEIGNIVGGLINKLKIA